MACALARDYHARLVLLHVVTPPPVVYGEGIVAVDPELLFQEGQGRLERIEIPDALIPVERRIEKGDPAIEILCVAEELPADLIVLGTHGRSGVARMLLGSVAARVVASARCPVMTVRGR